VVGRTLTAGNRDNFKFAFVNCQNLQEGFYPVYRDIASDDTLDLVVHLGDYIRVCSSPWRPQGV
jgi:alkaline phosphatase D